MFESVQPRRQIRKTRSGAPAKDRKALAGVEDIDRLRLRTRRPQITDPRPGEGQRILTAVAARAQLAGVDAASAAAGKRAADRDVRGDRFTPWPSVRAGPRER
jgi:hypothetical protein